MARTMPKVPARMVADIKAEIGETATVTQSEPGVWLLTLSNERTGNDRIDLTVTFRGHLGPGSSG